jgi:hypothetical protein
MANFTAITTGEQSVAATGPITGTLSTVTLAAPFTFRLRVRGLAAGQTISIGLEDTANATPFSDAIVQWVTQVTGVAVPEGTTDNKTWYQLPAIRIGAANCKVRFNCYSITGGATALVEGWMEQ